MCTKIFRHVFIGLSYIERPTLGDKPKAQNHENEKSSESCNVNVVLVPQV